VPAVVICSDSFLALGRGQARNLGDPDLPIAVITHPLGGLGADEVRARAAEAAPQVIALLRGGGA
jgi:hypothetical protein